MTPAFKIVSEGKDLTPIYESRLVSITVTDQATEQSDSCSIELANHDGKLFIPDEGQLISVSLGYKNKLRRVGDFVVDSFSIDGPPDTITVSGKATPFAAVKGFKPFQTRKTRSWDQVTLGNLIRKVAGEAGLTAAVSPEFNGWLLHHLDQTNESDMNLLTRLARDWRAVMKVQMGYLIFVKRGEAVSISGTALASVVVDRSQCSRWSAQLGQRTKFSKVRTKFHDPATGKSMRVTASENDSMVEELDPDEIDDDGDATVYEHPLDYSDQLSAEQGAKSILDQTQRGSQTVSVTIAGNPDVIAEGNVILTGFQPKMNGAWCIKTVTHSLSKSAFSTTVQGEAPGGEAGKKKKSKSSSVSAAFTE